MVAECFGPWDYPCNEDRRWARRRPHLFLQPVFHTGLRKKQRFAFFWSITCHNPRTSLTSEGPAITLDMEVSEVWEQHCCALSALAPLIVETALSTFRLSMTKPNETIVAYNLTSTALPCYVMDYAPLVWLYSKETYMPSDIGQQLVHTTPMVNYTAIKGAPSPLTLNNLAGLNKLGNTSVYLTSIEGIDATPEPAWFRGVRPDTNGKTNGAVSSTIITRDHGNGTVDAFYFYFYAYNMGNTVLGMQFGDHVGDWEHNMIRFDNGVPQAIWYSQHAGGEAFTYDATEKQGKRPIAYSANGSHAVYAVPGTHDHAIPHLNLPFGFVMDYTDRGTLWDPIANAYAYSFDAASQTFQPYDRRYPVNWLEFNGQWGDDALPGGPELFGQAKYSAGPNGPKFKHLVRSTVCPDSPCVVLPFRIWDDEDGEMMSRGW